MSGREPPATILHAQTDKKTCVKAVIPLEFSEFGISRRSIWYAGVFVIVTIAVKQKQSFLLSIVYDDITVKILTKTHIILPIRKDTS